MKKLLFFTSVLALILSGCQDEHNTETIQATGTVVDYAGAGSCGFVIELDNGQRIQPMFYPEDFSFAQGQRVLIEYTELQDIIPTCDKGAACEITYVEELSCKPYVDLYFHNYDSLARDPLYIREAFVDGDCLQIKVSYSGGCREHTIELARMNEWYANGSSVAVFEIRHNANEDLCEAMFTKEIRFDLSPLKDEGKHEFVLTVKLPDGEVYNEIFEYNY